MSILEALALWRKIKPWLEKPWVKSILGFLSGFFKKATENPVEHPGRDNPDKPVTPDDILHPKDNV